MSRIGARAMDTASACRSQTVRLRSEPCKTEYLERQRKRGRRRRPRRSRRSGYRMPSPPRWHHAARVKPSGHAAVSGLPDALAAICSRDRAGHRRPKQVGHRQTTREGPGRRLETAWAQESRGPLTAHPSGPPSGRRAHHPARLLGRRRRRRPSCRAALSRQPVPSDPVARMSTVRR